MTDSSRSPDIGDSWVLIAKAAELTGIAERTIRKHCLSGKCPCRYLRLSGGRRVYQLNQASIDWLLANVPGRQKSRP